MSQDWKQFEGAEVEGWPLNSLSVNVMGGRFLSPLTTLSRSCCSCCRRKIPQLSLPFKAWSRPVTCHTKICFRCTVLAMPMSMEFHSLLQCSIFLTMIWAKCWAVAI